MLEDLRKNQKWIIWIIAIVFVAGMGMMGIVSMFNPTPFVGSIYGKKVYLQEYDRIYRQNMQQHQMQNPEATIDEQTMKNLNDQTWEQYVSRTIMDKQLKRYRIRVKDREVFDKIKNDPPQELRQNPDFLTNGVWDQQKYLSVIANNPQFALILEDYVKQMLPYEKLEQRIKDQVVVTVDSVRIDWLERNDKITGKVINLDWNTIEAQEVTDAEIAAYYDRHKNNYRIEDARKYRYVQLRLEPSLYDNERAAEDINYVYDLLLAGGDFGDLAEQYSQDPGSAARRGSLDFFGRGRMVAEFDSIAFSSEIGDMSEPFKTQFGWHIMLVTDKRTTEQGEEEVEASHILIRIEPSDITKMDLRNQAERLANEADRIGLENAIEGMELEIRETPEIFADTRNIPGIGNYPNLVAEAFKRRIGFVPGPVPQTDGSYNVLELSYSRAAHIQDLELVSDVIRREIDREKRTALVLEKAREMMSSYPPEEYLEQAVEYGFRVQDVADRLVTQTVPGVGVDRQLMDALFEKEADEWTDIISTDRGNYLGYISERNRPNMEDFFNNQESLTAEYRQRKEQTHYSAWYQKVREEAKIKDLRYEYYN